MDGVARVREFEATLERLTADLARLASVAERLQARSVELEKQLEDERAEKLRAVERVEALEREVKELRGRLAESERAAKRQAGPFRRRESKKIPKDRQKRPGNKPGHKGSCRDVPEHVDQEVEVPLNGCPCCGGPVESCRPVEQVIEEIPEVRPTVTRLVTYVGHCKACGEVQSSHPLQMSTATGAARVQVGPRALALASYLRSRLGCTVRTTLKILRKVAGLKMSPGGLIQALKRHQGKLKNPYESLIKDLQKAPATFADETGWYVASSHRWLWVFTNASTTVFRIDAKRDAAVVNDVLGQDFQGVLVSDCLASYESTDYRRQSCHAHHLREIAALESVPGATTPSYMDRIKRLLRSVRMFWSIRGQLSPETYRALCQGIRAELELWASEPCERPGDLKIRQRLAKRLPTLTACLDEPSAEPTNNRSERELRYAVIARKLSCGHRTDSGAEGFAKAASLFRTLEQRGGDPIAWLASLLPRAAPPVPFPSIPSQS